ncbi:MAG: terpene cyclase/mutase family protein [Bacteroidales bacterium]|nr:terpene cyclase/mutase family protein [Bacteroidales bacterium]
MTNEKNYLSNSISLLQKYVETQNYKGYDPYDTLNSWIPFHWFGKWSPVLAIQFQKRNPVNIRPLLGIKKGINPKAFGLLLNGYSLLYQKDKNPDNLAKMNHLFNLLYENPSEGYQGMGWGYNFPWASPVKYLKPFVPSSVVTGFVCKGVFQYYKATGNDKAKVLLEKAREFILNELPQYQDDSGLSISYTPVMQDVCYNASLLAGEVLAMNYHFNPNESLKTKCVNLVNFVVSRQKPDGSWAYSEDVNTGRERIQVDFHQGYVIESIYEIMQLLHIRDEKWEKAIAKGLKYYKEQQFFEDGRSLWRIPKVYPVEIHNQSQGIITFSKLYQYDDSYLLFAKQIAEWTTNNMQAKDGHFYYQKFKTYSHKIPYMRWSQAWMFLALSNLIKK